MIGEAAAFVLSFVPTVSRVGQAITRLTTKAECLPIAHHSSGEVLQQACRRLAAGCYTILFGIRREMAPGNMWRHGARNRGSPCTRDAVTYGSVANRQTYRWGVGQKRTPTARQMQFVGPKKALRLYKTRLANCGAAEPSRPPAPTQTPTPNRPHTIHHPLLHQVERDDQPGVSREWKSKKRAVSVQP